MCGYLYSVCIYFMYVACPFGSYRFGIPLENELDVIQFFNHIDTWGMDMFHLNEITKGHPLITTSCAIFRV